MSERPEDTVINLDIQNGRIGTKSPKVGAPKPPKVQRIYVTQEMLDEFARRQAEEQED